MCATLGWGWRHCRAVAGSAAGRLAGGANLRVNDPVTATRGVRCSRLRRQSAAQTTVDTPPALSYIL